MSLQLAIFDDIAHAVEGIYSPRRAFVLFLLVGLSFCLVVNSSWHATPDSALYLELGESVARGNGYQFNGEPHTYVPPGYPMIVAISAYCFYANFLTYRILMAVIGLLTAVTGYLLIMRLCGRDTALLIGGLFAVNHILLQNSTYTTSDVPFALISLLALHATLSAAYSRRIIFWALAAGLIMGLPPLFRVNGWGLPPAAAFFLFFVWKDRPSIKRLGCAAVFLFFSLIPTFAWEFYKSTFPASVNEGTYINALTGRSLDTQISIILKSAWDYVQESSYALTGVSIKTGVFEWICPLLVILGMAIAWRRGDRLLVPVTILQFFGLFLAPAGSRYLILLIPGLYIFLALALIRVAGFVTRTAWIESGMFSGARFLLLAVLGLLATFNFGHNMITIYHARTPLDAYGAESRRDAPFFTAAQWLRSQPADTIVMTMYPRVLHYLSGLRTVELVRSGVPEHQAWVEDADQIRQLICTKNPAFLFSDASNPVRFKKTIAAIENSGLRLKEIPEAVPIQSKRFRIWKICHDGC
ncbi:MAG: ArnT family glycosyltransferase [Desulfomonilaceae bacterium]